VTIRPFEMRQMSYALVRVESTPLASEVMLLPRA
jgi:hypothetical protein